jgi:hypothetical protein
MCFEGKNMNVPAQKKLRVDRWACFSELYSESFVKHSVDWPYRLPSEYDQYAGRAEIEENQNSEDICLRSSDFYI